MKIQKNRQKNKKNIEKIIYLLKTNYRFEKFPIKYKTNMQLLCAVILSAQCTDKMVNLVTKNLFKKYKTAKDFANANLKNFEQQIKSTGFYHNKAKNIINTAKIIEKKHRGKIPKRMEDLLVLPGVARKTANVVIQKLYKIQSGIVVDTHIIRVSTKIGLSDKKTAEKIEKDLMKIILKKDWIKISSQIKQHGQKICKPRPLCEICFLKRECDFYNFV